MYFYRYFTQITAEIIIIILHDNLSKIVDNALILWYNNICKVTNINNERMN